MTNSLGPLFDKTSLDQKIEALKKDLLAEDGPPDQHDAELSFCDFALRPRRRI